MVKVLGIVGSPRKGGNTEIMMEEALAAARTAGAETEIYPSYGKNIAGCDGCHACMSSGRCKIKDDMQELYDKMEAADAIILGSPVYFHGVTAQAKTIMDRTFCFLFKHNLADKVGGSILALRKIGASQTRAQINTWFLSHHMHPVMTAVGYGRAEGDVRTAEGAGIGTTAMQEARMLGEEIVRVFNNLT